MYFKSPVFLGRKKENLNSRFKYPTVMKHNNEADLVFSDIYINNETEVQLDQIVSTPKRVIGR